MADFTVPFADGVDKNDTSVFRALTDAQMQAGFSCGPADLGTFNWLLYQITQGLLSIQTQSQAPTGTSGLGQGTIS